MWRSSACKYLYKFVKFLWSEPNLPKRQKFYHSKNFWYIIVLSAILECQFVCIYATCWMKTWHIPQILNETILSVQVISHYCEIVDPLLQAIRSGDGLKGWMRFQYLCTNKWFPVTPHLCTVSSSVYSGYLLSTYSYGIRTLSAMEYGLFWCSLLSPLFLSTGFRSSFLRLLAHSSFCIRKPAQQGLFDRVSQGNRFAHWVLTVGGRVTKHTVTNQSLSH